MWMQKLDLENADESKINAFKMKALRRLLHVSCTDRRTKKGFYRKPGQTLICSLTKLKLLYPGYIIQNQEKRPFRAPLQDYRLGRTRTC